jgi:hypothetical protein
MSDNADDSEFRDVGVVGEGSSPTAGLEKGK